MDFNIDDLRWIRAFSPDVVPKYLVEQIKHREFEVEDFYTYQRLSCLQDTKNGQTLNPFNHLYVLADKENLVKGFFWAIIDPLTKDFVINNYSVDKNYWGGGKPIKKIVDFVKEIIKKMNLKKVFWITRYPNHSERHGFKRSRYVLMEYEEEQNG